LAYFIAMKNSKFIALSLVSFLLSFASMSKEQTYVIKKITTLEVTASINPATFNYLKTNLNKLSADKGDLAVLKLDTPGGLVTTTKEILTLIGSLNFPFIVWITPEGASATSAGSIIACAAHLLVMSEGTNLGAATPVGLGDDIKQEDGRAKAVNDLVALVSALAKARGRNAEKFSQMISEAKSFDAQTALKENIINAIVNSEADLIRYFNNKKIRLHGEDIALSLDPHYTSTFIEMDPGQKILNIFANPMTAYILFIIGAALLYLEFQAPGGFVAGSIGAVFLILAAIGFQVLPLNYGALGLIVLSFILFIMEAYITSYGVLTLGGIASLVFGSLFLFRTDNAYLDIQLPMILSVVVAIVLYVIFIGFVIVKTRRQKSLFFTTQEQIGHISKFIGRDADQFVYQVKVAGEIWKTNTNKELSIGAKVKVLEQDNIHMQVTITEL
jgi:membrane-bound serine protease (ClpP class)